MGGYYFIPFMPRKVTPCLVRELLTLAGGQKDQALLHHVKEWVSLSTQIWLIVAWWHCEPISQGFILFVYFCFWAHVWNLVKIIFDLFVSNDQIRPLFFECHRPVLSDKTGRNRFLPLFSRRPGRNRFLPEETQPWWLTAADLPWPGQIFIFHVIATKMVSKIWIVGS